MWDYFATSVRMSTYLVAALVSEFTNKAADPSLSNVQFRIWARPNAMNLTEYNNLDIVSTRSVHFLNCKSFPPYIVTLLTSARGFSNFSRTITE